MEKNAVGWRNIVNQADATRSLSRKYPVINRAFFKLIEIADAMAQIAPRRIVHLCEAPGGFVQAGKCAWPDASRVAFSIESEDGIQFHRAVSEHVVRNLHAGGDLCCAEGADAVVRSVGDALADLVTSDGGVSHDENLDLAEQNSVRMLLAQLWTILSVQADGGACVLKFFEGSTRATMDAIRVLRLVYDKVQIHKPRTSRATNSERYVVGEGYDRARGTVLASELRPVLAFLESHAGLYLYSLLDDDPVAADSEGLAAACERQSAAIRQVLDAADAADSRWAASQQARDVEFVEGACKRIMKQPPPRTHLANGHAKRKRTGGVTPR